MQLFITVALRRELGYHINNKHRQFCHFICPRLVRKVPYLQRTEGHERNRSRRHQSYGFGDSGDLTVGSGVELAIDNIKYAKNTDCQSSCLKL